MEDTKTPQTQNTSFLAHFKSAGSGRIVSSFDNPAQTMRYLQIADSADELIGKPQKISDVIVRDFDIVDDDTGEITPAIRIVLVTPNGKAYTTVSMGVFDDLTLLTSPEMYGIPPWSPPVELEIVKRKTNKGFQVSRLVPVVK